MDFRQKQLGIMQLRKSFIALLPLVSLAAAQSGLDALAKGAGKKYFGTATDPDEFSDTAYMAVMDSDGQFGMLTPGNSMKWVCSAQTSRFLRLLTFPICRMRQSPHKATSNSTQPINL